ncbi:shikimate kinase i / shikimate 5-dehydrogenase i alpha [hydrocarbon metagenome]|uniref:Shikimate kinase i / shikimate 5-dehydrogenase i alpha n=1 Tax=hydrocarbon metagenome TaxID=938273 RepID=A0A0W8FJ62_9ZZZZ
MILNRTPEKARALAERAGCGWGPISAFDKDDFDVVVNATPIGMEPDPGSPLSADQLRAGMTVFDLVYTPPETPLLRLARSAGCETIPGTEMFVHQGCEQFRLFTGISVPPALIREVIT